MIESETPVNNPSTNSRGAVRAKLIRANHPRGSQRSVPVTTPGEYARENTYPTMWPSAFPAVMVPRMLMSQGDRSAVKTRIARTIAPKKIALSKKNVVLGISLPVTREIQR